MLKGLLIWILFATALAPAKAQRQAVKGGQWPVPKNIPGLLFYIQRDPDINTVCYAVNQENDGSISQDEPIDVFWMNYAADGKRKELNQLQREFGYGIKSKKLGTDKYQLKVVALPGRPMLLTRGIERGFVVKTTINHRPCILSRVYIRIVGGTRISPDVEYIELTGTDEMTGSIVNEKMTIK